MAQLSLRLPDALLSSLREEAERAGFTNVSDYARRKLAASTPLSGIDQRLGRVEESLSLLLERTARIESRLGETPPSLTPSRPTRWSAQYAQMVEVDMDGRDIPPD